VLASKDRGSKTSALIQRCQDTIADDDERLRDRECYLEQNLRLGQALRTIDERDRRIAALEAALADSDRRYAIQGDELRRVERRLGEVEGLLDAQRRGEIQERDNKTIERLEDYQRRIFRVLATPRIGAKKEVAVVVANIVQAALSRDPTSRRIPMYLPEVMEGAAVTKTTASTALHDLEAAGLLTLTYETSWTPSTTRRTGNEFAQRRDHLLVELKQTPAQFLEGVAQLGRTTPRYARRLRRRLQDGVDLIDEAASKNKTQVTEKAESNNWSLRFTDLPMGPKIGRSFSSTSRISDDDDEAGPNPFDDIDGDQAEDPREPDPDDPPY
jgi:hypothetical protein